VREWVIGYAAAGVVFLVLDLIWLSTVGRALYWPTLGAVLAERVNVSAAVAFYVIYIAGILVFAVQPGLKAHSLLVACGMGAMFGLVAYATYDLTNLATLKAWSLKLTLVDMVWGTFLTSIAAGAAYLAATGWRTG
jgi:uncharacterized membrane protein